MFKFSFNWLKDHCGKNIKFDEIIDKLRTQGFEFQGSQKIGDDIVTAIEVKANRPDMLSHMGISREIKAFDGEKIPHIEKSDIMLDNSNFPIKIDVNKDVCKRFCAVKISGVNASAPTPKYIKERLSALGIHTVNAIVDIGNYLMLDLGNPLHCYDADKLEGNSLNIDLCKKDQKITTFSGEQSEIKAGDIVISDSSGVKCVAGIIGTDSGAVTTSTKNVVVESAVFDEVKVRLTSRRLKISTPSSFRFERGVNASASFDVLSIYVKMIIKICGGTVEGSGFDCNYEQGGEKFLKLDVKKVNNLLGISISKNDVIKCLEKYDFNCRDMSNDLLEVKIPDYRLDIKIQEDLIEEVARIYGYDNIVPIMPTIQIGYHKNQIWDNIDIARAALSGLGFNETINYSFIPSDTMKIFDINSESSIYSDLLLQNPIAGAYSLMRPTLVYSLLNCLAYNYSVGNNNLALFELGRVYFRDKSFDTGCREIDTCGFIMSGVRIPRGFGISSDIKYTYYDLLGYLKIIMDKFGVDFTLEKSDYKFCEENSSYNIVVCGEKIGFIGELNRFKLNKVNNVKLIKDKIFYGEFYLTKLCENIRKIKFISKYPPVNRLYNLVQNKSISAREVMDIIKSSDNIIRNVTVKDIYSDKSFADDTHAILYEVNYCSPDCTLTSEKIESTEKKFLEKLKNSFNINFKQ